MKHVITEVCLRMNTRYFILFIYKELRTSHKIGFEILNAPEL